MSSPWGEPVPQKDVDTAPERKPSLPGRSRSSSGGRRTFRGRPRAAQRSWPSIHGWRLLAALLAAVSGSHLRTGAAPPGNSVAERLILTMKSELMWTPDWKLSHELRAALVQWLDVYDNEQPQQALGWKTPRE